MNRLHLVLLWHMHQPQYRDPTSGRYVLPWTRLHALKDYWGMVKILEEFPGVHATFNLVPSLMQQLEEYVSGRFDEPWFQLAFKPADQLTEEDKAEVLARAFQVNRENLMHRWPRYVALFEAASGISPESARRRLSLRDWRDLQLLSQLAWMDEEYLARDPVVSALSRRGSDFAEADKLALRDKQMELLGRVILEYRSAAARGQVELSTTPFYHPILPLLIDTDVARVSNPWTPPLEPAFRNPEDAREQLARARANHERLFGQPPGGLWPSEGSVSDAVLALAADLGFRWFATDEGVLGRTFGIGFWRDGAGIPENADRLYRPVRFRIGQREITGLFRDHYLSDLIGFVYSRMDAAAAAEDLHRRLRAIGERLHSTAPLTVSIILDGENAWEYYPGNGREFLRRFYGRIQGDPDIRALTVSEAIAAAEDIPVAPAIFPASWINANFDIWIGHPEDLRAWELLRETREFYARAERHGAEGLVSAPTPEQLARARESILAAEGSDWCWWYGPEHFTANAQDFDELYRQHLTEVYKALGAPAPEKLAEPIKRRPERALVVPPSSYLDVKVDGRVTSYFEWLGAGLYSAERRTGAMHGRSYFLHELYYGFSPSQFFLRLDPVREAIATLQNCEFRITLHAVKELRLTAEIREGRLVGYSIEVEHTSLPNPRDYVLVAFDQVLEVALEGELFQIQGLSALKLSVALWRGGLPVDTLPAEGWLEVKLGEEAFAWPLE
jgi:alpha-amylase/alpha-mannosidase (GH57 family)